MSRQNKSILKPYKWLAAFFCWFSIGFLSPCMADTIIDSHGRQIDISTPFKRIISLYGAHTENLFSLGLEENIIGVTVNETYPDQAQEKMKFSYHDDPEKFIGAMPDLVLIRPMIDNGYPKFVQQLEKYKIVVVSLQPATVPEMYAYWLTLGRLTGKQDQAQKMVLDFQQKVAHLQALAQKIPQKKKVYFQAIHSRMKTFTPGSMPIFALETAGGINVAADAIASRNTNIAIYGKEQILAKAWEIDVFLAQKGIMNPIQEEQILNEPGFHIIKAIKNKQVFLIDENIVSRPVPRLYLGMVTIGTLLYPDIFSQLSIK
ncbi:MAG: ABC transporter substrate-binding protein [Proteobacteria bacterium]|nr:ABC transporter substrate-binding protein [Desulfobacula sp.]MBU3951065.1 ABC transporter substrate-binding protein [Pseudomonadota bacterium]MBU4133545.1 ABC transporter substrate-binding protein [Pseudomonadota bacterium]